MPGLTAEKLNLNIAFPLLVLQQASEPGYPSRGVMHAGNNPWPLITTHEQRPFTP
ncbi:hypothetical protein CGRA01v4_02066 [Colletotrichum graminicola]|nr:hypothetical protein CGRA01v4_02066 [Colletotrichum graminicola]